MRANPHQRSDRLPGRSVEQAGTPALDVQNLCVRLDRIEECLRRLVQQQLVLDFYSTSDVARLLGKAEFTVREWCRLGRIRAEKRPCGRGNSREWMIGHKELTRIQSEGLLPTNHL